jgi:hypothetical protein
VAERKLHGQNASCPATLLDSSQLERTWTVHAAAVARSLETCSAPIQCDRGTLEPTTVLRQYSMSKLCPALVFGHHVTITRAEAQASNVVPAAVLQMPASGDDKCVAEWATNTIGVFRFMVLVVWSWHTVAKVRL